MMAPTHSPSALNDPQPVGKVYLVGAGPGDPELITVRGLRLLRSAQVVVFDRLIHPDLIQEAPANAERCYVGKAQGHQVLPQKNIHQLLVDRARAGLLVVRLKGGDPFVFGRGGEEAEALTAAGIPWRVVPAVTSAVAVPASAGIPLTYRGVASTFAVVTAHQATAHQADSQNSGTGIVTDIHWQALGQIDTLVVLMAVSTLATVTQRLQLYRSAETPAALIERGTLVEERIITGTLGDIAVKARRENIRPPATLVIGEVVALGKKLRDTALLSAWQCIPERHTTEHRIIETHGAKKPASSNLPAGVAFYAY